MRLILPHAARGLAHTNRTDTAMEHRAVRGRTARHAETLYDALEALALRDADDVDQLALGKRGRIDDIADLERGSVLEANFGENARGILETGLLRVANFATGGVLGLLLREAELHGIVAVDFNSLDLNH